MSDLPSQREDRRRAERQRAAIVNATDRRIDIEEQGRDLADTNLAVETLLGSISKEQVEGLDST